MVRERVQQFVDTLELDEHAAARAEIALVLAAKLDQAAASESPGIAQASSSIARELRETLDALSDGQGETLTFVSDLFREPA